MRFKKVYVEKVNWPQTEAPFSTAFFVCKLTTEQAKREDRYAAENEP
jgi:hypothetical protein